MTTSMSAYRIGQGPALLLLHGIGSSRTGWDHQISRLKNSFTCIAPDLPGYGDSPDPAEPGLGAIVRGLAAVLDGRSAHVIGVSFGALAALAIARTYPSLVKSLVLADATLGKARERDSDRERWLMHRRALAGNLASRSLERAGEIAAPGAPVGVIEEIAAHMRRARPAGYLAVAQAIFETDAVPWLDRIVQPALIICGDQDSVTGLGVSEALAKHLPRAKLVEVAGAGHAPHIERPDRFAHAVQEFLNELSRTDGAAVTAD
ncbi:3-oxoadipate enol-lactonase 2 [Bradyrhizobium ivorense]|uniref:3-oxoadipate enol-lactonase 2 n=1 Tax=Bradyrhizobium ivorense TaxID=2511166 RepID=A0A508TG80_9BRAD|nr:alpha/beta hydrolase [Bradyrhizobium ivorense]VIO72937.1 3-oxoadipate enol-lactonase 2 [Bradyrhizobium ivorense]